MQSVQLSMMANWANDGKMLINDGEMLVNDGEMLVNDGEMLVNEMVQWVYDHNFILPLLTGISLSVMSITPSLTSILT